MEQYAAHHMSIPLHPSSRQTRRRSQPLSQHGMTLISVLAALLIFSFGLLGVAQLYSTLTQNHTANEQVTAVQMFGDRFWATLQAQPALLAELQSSAASPSVRYSDGNLDDAPQALRPALHGLFDGRNMLPDAVVSIALEDDVRGAACAATTCGVFIAVKWSGPRGTRTQTFFFQVGGY